MGTTRYSCGQTIKTIPNEDRYLQITAEKLTDRCQISTIHGNKHGNITSHGRNQEIKQSWFKYP